MKQRNLKNDTLYLDLEGILFIKLGSMLYTEESAYGDSKHASAFKDFKEVLYSGQKLEGEEYPNPVISSVSFKSLIKNKFKKRYQGDL